MTDVSIVTSTFNSDRTIKEFIGRVREAVKSLEAYLGRSLAFEIVVVDDGSTDGTRAILSNEVQGGGNLRVLMLSRNYGQHAAMLQGMHEAVGSMIFILDSDLEDSPEWLLLFWKERETDGDSSVHGEYQRLQGPFWRRVGGKAFWSLYNKLGSLELPTNQTMARLMTRQYLDAALQSRRSSSLLAEVFSAAGNSRPTQVEKAFKGYSSYSIWQRVSTAMRQLVISSTDFWWRISSTFLLLGIAISLVTTITALIQMSQFIIVYGLAVSGMSFLVTIIALAAVMLRSVIEKATEVRPVIVKQKLLSKDQA